MKLNRIHILFIGLGIIVLYLFLNRFDFIWGSSTTTGKVIGFEKWVARTGRISFRAPIIQFSTDNEQLTFQGETDMDIKLGETVEVIYKPSNPTNAEVYTFAGFWLSPIIYCLIPLIILIAAAFSFLKPSDTITINFSKGKKLQFDRHRNKKIKN